MTPFLKQVAAHYYRQGNIENTCFIFPSRRSEVFFMKHLSDIVARESAEGGKPARPLLAPRTFTINDFIYRIYDIVPTDRVTLLLELYKVYSRLFPKAEPLDEFIFWGYIIIADFNDTDKYLADASQLFTNIADLKSIQDSYSYLSDRQRQAIEAFAGHFSDGKGRLTVDLKSENPKVKERFLQIWNILHPMYTEFRKALSDKKMAYEGMVYRGVAERFEAGPAQEILGKTFRYAEKFVFVGLNALNECEKTVMRKMKQAGTAEFCWDWSGEMIRDRYNKSSFFMKENIREFPQAFAFGNDDVSVPEISVISVPSSVGQAKLLPGIFREIGNTEDCAVVLPDETLLMTVLNSIPPEIADINVTMGYPMTSSAFYQFMDIVTDVQMNLRRKDGKLFFYHRPVRALFSDSIFRLACGPEGEEKIEAVKSRSEIYIPAEELQGDGIFSAVFRPAIEDRDESGTGTTDRFAGYLSDVISAVITALGNSRADKVEIEFAMEYLRTVTVLRRTPLPVKPRTYVRILRQILSPVSVPFKGEPLRGLQIMGPLETRALDFGNIVIMSANEGIFPRKNVSSSFIPPELRRGFGLPTYEYQDAVWAYYFYRMISRARNVWMLYDSRTEGIKSGEESRYIRQLKYHFDIPVREYVAGTSLGGPVSDAAIPKTEEDTARIRELVYSATSLQEYLSCRAKFYYRYIKGLGDEEEVTEVMDAGLFGTVFHEIMQCIYLGEEAMASDLPASVWVRTATAGDSHREISADCLRSWIRRRDAIREKVRKVIMREMHTLEISGRNLVITDVIVRYVMQALSVDLELLKRSGKKSFRIIGLEKNCSMEFMGFRLKGKIDRIDSFGDGIARIVDYKTGKVQESDVNITERNAEATADAVFGPDNSKRPKIALQLYIYDRLLMQDGAAEGYEIRNCVYSTTGLFSELPETRPLVPAFISAMDSRLGKLFGELTDPGVPFDMTPDVKVCEYCDFKTICGR